MNIQLMSLTFYYLKFLPCPYGSIVQQSVLSVYTETGRLAKDVPAAEVQNLNTFHSRNALQNQCNQPPMAEMLLDIVPNDLIDLVPSYVIRNLVSISM